MPLEDVTHKGQKKGIKMTACPCGYELGHSEQLEAHLLRDHNPEDFGLTPMRTGQQSLASFEEDDGEEVMPDGGA
ncbi:MAG: hypothetical protein ABEI86_06240 [Halobacteriaceae archaeon]